MIHLAHGALIYFWYLKGGPFFETGCLILFCFFLRIWSNLWYLLEKVKEGLENERVVLSLAVVAKFWDGIYCLKEPYIHGQLKLKEPRFISMYMYSNSAVRETERGRLLE